MLIRNKIKTPVAEGKLPHEDLRITDSSCVRSNVSVGQYLSGGAQGHKILTLSALVELNCPFKYSSHFKCA